MITKKELRKETLKKRDALTVAERIEKSHKIANYVLAQPSFEKADVILLYASFRSEVDTEEIFAFAKERKKRIYFPKVLGDKMEFYRVERETDFENGCWGIREPRVESCERYLPQEKECVCVIMPGAVFDKDGNRIGYGGGYYDKYLQWLTDEVEMKKLAVNVYKMSIAFVCQMIPTGIIQREDHDVKIDAIITEENVFFFRT